MEVRMKKLWISTLLIIVLLISSSCTKKVSGDEYTKAEQLIKEADYDGAIKSLEKLLEKDEFDLKARDLIAEAYIASESYEDADEWLSDYFDFVSENLDNDDLNVKKAVDSLGDYGRDILRASETVGSWYEEIKPSMVKLDSVELSYAVGQVVELDIPKNSQVFYTLDYTSPITDGIEYKDGISFDSVGYYELAVVTKSKFGEYSSISRAYIDIIDENSMGTEDTENTIADPSDLLAVTINIEDGTYDEQLKLEVTNYDPLSERYQILYTLNQSDPRDFTSTRYFYDYLDLFVGQYDFTFCAYDSETDTYSDLTYASIYINNPESIKIGLFGLPNKTIEEYRYLFEQAYWEGFYPELVIIDDINNIDTANIPDAIITYDYYAEDLATYSAIVDVDLYFDLSQYEYIGNAVNAGRFEGVNYMLPLTIRPEFMVYGDYSSGGQVTWESLSEPSSWYENKFMYAIDKPEYLLGIYYGLGGAPLDTENSNITLDKAKLIEALKVIASMPTSGIGSSLYSAEDVNNALTNFTVESVLFDDSLLHDPNYEYSYYGVGAMPLPNGNHARYYNVVTGLFVTNVWEDENKAQQVQSFYDFVINAEYNYPYIAQSEGSLPAIKAYSTNSSISYAIDLATFNTIIEEGITQIRSYALYNLYDAMSTPLTNLLDGATPEEVATQILSALGQ